MNGNRRRASNKIRVNSLAWGIALVCMAGMAAFFFVYLKNQQHAAGDQTRLVERELREVEARNEALKARITALTSRGALQRRLDDGYVRLIPIRDTSIARVGPTKPAEDDGVLRTASRDPDGTFGSEAPQRSVKR